MGRNPPKKLDFQTRIGLISSSSFEVNFKSYLKLLESEHFELDLRLTALYEVNSNESNRVPPLRSQTLDGQRI